MAAAWWPSGTGTPGAGRATQRDVFTPGLRKPSARSIMHRNCNAPEGAMKTATIPSLRVDPGLRQAAEDVLEEGETLSSFVELALRTQVQARQQQDAFIARGLAARHRARQTGRHVAADTVLSALEARLRKARTTGK
jgi:predicted transcriptional regulator